MGTSRLKNWNTSFYHPCEENITANISKIGHVCRPEVCHIYFAMVCFPVMTCKVLLSQHPSPIKGIWGESTTFRLTNRTPKTWKAFVLYMFGAKHVQSWVWGCFSCNQLCAHNHTCQFLTNSLRECGEIEKLGWIEVLRHFFGLVGVWEFSCLVLIEAKWLDKSDWCPLMRYGPITLLDSVGLVWYCNKTNLCIVTGFRKSQQWSVQFDNLSWQRFSFPYFNVLCVYFRTD